MRNSSAKQLEFEYLTNAGGGISDVGGANVSTPNAVDDPLKFPDFSRADPAVAAASRMAGRINAANISDRELDDLLKERSKLLDKKFEDTISRRESNRLEYVSWTLDRIEDARSGQALDALESFVNQYEAFLEDLDILHTQLKSKIPTKKKTRRKK